MRKFIFLMVLSNYIGIVAFGFLSHQIYHHFKDKLHHHTLSCVNEILNESLHGEDSSASSTISEIHCEFEQLTKEFHRLNTFESLDNFSVARIFQDKEYNSSTFDTFFEALVSGLQKNRDPPSLISV